MSTYERYEWSDHKSSDKPAKAKAIGEYARRRKARKAGKASRRRNRG